jgi:transglutaminase-like putative cysteine protease
VSRRMALGSLILLLWVVMVGLHVRREYMQPELTRLALATLTLAPGTHFYSVHMGGQPLGTASSRLDTVPEGFLLEDMLDLELQAMGQRGSAVARTQVVLSPTLTMREFHFSLTSEAGRFAADGVVEGDSLLRVQVDAGGGTSEEVTFRVDESPLFAAALPIRLAKGGLLREGRIHRFPVFDPSTVSTRIVEVEVLERDQLLLPDSAFLDPGSGRWLPAEPRSIDVWRVQERYGGISVESWIDEDGRVVRSSSPLGFSLERTPFELARQARDESRDRMVAGDLSGDVILSTAIRSHVELDRVADHRELRFLLSGVELEGFDLEGGRQELRGDTLVVRREVLEELHPGYQLPYPRMDLRAALESEPLIQSGDPRIQAEARRIAGRSRGVRTDPLQVAVRLNEAVHRMLRKEITFSFPSATQVLESRVGDCNEHTVLYVALARALGLPARTAVGLVYLDGAFYYHAWPEVWLGEWVAMDPTFGQAPADAAHLRFVTGSLAQQVEVARLIGNLRIEVLEGPPGPRSAAPRGSE